MFQAQLGRSYFLGYLGAAYGDRSGPLLQPLRPPSPNGDSLNGRTISAHFRVQTQSWW